MGDIPRPVTPKEQEAPTRTVSVKGSPIVIAVKLSADVHQAASAGKQLAASIGFPAEHGQEIHLVVMELGSNLIRHALQGTLRLSAIESDGRVGIRIESEDEGPGIADVEEAMTDGFSTAAGLGLGLGTVNRLMDDLEFTSGGVAGLRVVCDRWVRPKATGLQARELVFGIATRPCRHQQDNGDAFLVKHWDRSALAGVIDGLGHGPLAMRASRTARQYVEQHYDQPLENVFRGADRACRATRGVVMALARFDLPQRKFRLANVGNIEVRLVGGKDRFNTVVRRGVIGLNAPNPVCTEHSWTEGCILVMHSDGLRSSWDWADFRSAAGDPPDVIAHRLLNTLSKGDDDATVLVGRSALG